MGFTIRLGWGNGSVGVVIVGFGFDLRPENFANCANSIVKFICELFLCVSRMIILT